MDVSNIDLTSIVMTYGPRIVFAILTLIVGLWVIKILVNVIKKGLDKGDVDNALRGFLASISSVLLKILVYITALSVLGVEMTSFVAILAAAGFAIGMALSGTLQNFSGGVMILLFKPFKIGDYIDAQGHSGSVKEIQIFNTILTTPDNKTIILPNGPLSTGAMVNYSTEPKRRVDWTVGIGYGDDVDKAYEVIEKLLAEDGRILSDPEPFIAVSELADSSVNFAVRGWVEAADYWGVFFRMNEAVYKTFEKEGLNIPYPQTDVHIHKV